MKISQFIRWGKTELAEASLQCADPLLHIKQIVMAGLDWPAEKLYIHWDDELSDSDCEKLKAIVLRRTSGEPFQYIVGYEWFWESKFAVGPGVLIPRKETEILVEKVLSLSEPDSEAKVVELGAGSGNIGISLLLERPRWEWHGFELNPDSLPYLTRNRKDLLSENANYHIHAEDFFIGAEKLGLFDFLVANPPYLSSEELKAIPKEVSYEPKLALFGGEDGLEFVCRLSDFASRYLKPRGWFLSEIGYLQEAQAMEAAKKAGLIDIACLKDYSGLPRILVARKG